MEIYSNWFLNCQALIFPLLVSNASPKPVQYHKKSLFYFLEIYFILFLNSQALMFPLLSNYGTPTPVQAS